MAPSLVAGGLSAVLMGAALIAPVVTARLENGGLSWPGIGVAAVGFGVTICGVAAVWAGCRQRRASVMPSGVRAAVAANMLFLAFFALELSDRLIR